MPNNAEETNNTNENIIMAKKAMLVFSTLYSFNLGGLFFLSAIRTFHLANTAGKILRPFVSTRSSDTSAQGALDMFKYYNKQVSIAKFSALKDGGIACGFFENAYSTGSCLYAGKEVSTPRIVANGIVAAIGIRNIMHCIL